MLLEDQCTSVANPKYISSFVETGDPHKQVYKYCSLLNSQHQSRQRQHPRGAMSAAMRTSLDF